MAQVVPSEQISADKYLEIQADQCPLPPRAFKYVNSNNEQCQTVCCGYYCDEKFWVQDGDSGKVYAANLSGKSIESYKNRLNWMRTVDEYLSKFRLTNSTEVFTRLSSAVNRADSITSFGGSTRTAQEYREKFKPLWKHRITFWNVVIRGMLNAYFIVYNFYLLFSDDHGIPSDFYAFVFLVNTVEALLWSIALIRTIYNVYSLTTRVCTGDTTHFQCKNIPEILIDLASLSVMRWLPNGETVIRFKKYGKEWFYEKRANFKFETDNAHTFKVLVAIRWIILTVLDVIGPFVAVFSLLFKMAQLNFRFESFTTWNYYEILGYFAFVNQVAGIRNIKRIEIDTLEHFIFSGSDARIQEEEVALMNAWWNWTLVSCVANISDGFRFPVYDSIVFWYNINVERIELLFKKHDCEGSAFVKKLGTEMKTKQDLNKTHDEMINLNQQQLLNAIETESFDVVVTSNTNTSAAQEEEEEAEVVVEEEAGDDGNAGDEQQNVELNAIETESFDVVVTSNTNTSVAQEEEEEEEEEAEEEEAGDDGNAGDEQQNVDDEQARNKKTE
eukprot:CAMPEP_0202733160 /NCGR_PEP_ID=MMETSP1385-20130828/188024_1 /ASSEMBLY_ACC=CAM_ASM_000861 /TAXON_ID=933848 /ORGANISM="Elphidium margaritaceum" /LENGTH=556 /DNA_ID=CAMNT_0049399485 /DNA_START=44 /DNA_END=1714 /DNA_ORIENTATION=-